jgi:hypothetical protein
MDYVNTHVWNFSYRTKVSDRDLQPTVCALGSIHLNAGSHQSIWVRIGDESRELDLEAVMEMRDCLSYAITTAQAFLKSDRHILV